MHGFLMRGGGGTNPVLWSHKHSWGGHLGVTVGLTFAILCLDKFLQMKILGQARGMFSLCENLSSPKGWEKVCGSFYSSLWLCILTQTSSARLTNEQAGCV